MTPATFVAAIEALNDATLHSYELEREVRWALSVLADQRRDESPPAEIDHRIVKAMRALYGVQTGIARAVAVFRACHYGVGD